ncbi:TetR/AcrR family transcriptional regulator [Rhodoferax sp.]|uniref:TetR/AcrR family transcriptional regulator n=1 Tax=Rhodoferax sp. TaxID=50421 RepID=UPI002ACDFCED|nr:TetR/AcrR family transcriptional regulator [Rhodoferax sp.]MDZ7921015.1 TetR/AcrR family transcriptional regulator [Rhodoferax sp.]
MPAASSPPARQTYRHGDLRRALLEAGIALARAGGPAAVTLREATRRVGVAPNAAYRHFANQQDLLLGVRAHALSGVARAMEAALAALPPGLSPADHARASVRAVGTGYLRYAKAEPGLFRTAFALSDNLIQATPEWPTAGDSGRNPHELLCDALDLLVQAGAMPAARRPGAEVLAWSAVHGLAMLVIDGPLATPVGPHYEMFSQRLLTMVEQGL